MSTTDPIPRMFAALVDDAAIFPPGDAPVPDAVRAHAVHRSAWYADLVGTFVCSDQRLPELQRALDDQDNDEPLALSLTITGGAGAIEPALTWVRRVGRLALRGVEVALRDEADLAHNARRVTTVLATALPDGVDAFVELPRLAGTEATAGWLAALDEVAAAGHQLKVRTGGPDPSAFPAERALAVVVNAALDRELAFKCTAGLHHAVRHTASATGLEHHGFLNVLLATRVALDGAAVDDVGHTLAERDGAVLAAAVRDLGDDRLASARRWFRSYGSCSIDEPLADLAALDLI
ncbi:MAG: hypothetical protein ACRDO1_18265 [Nocardioidaceae bacterium]